MSPGRACESRALPSAAGSGAVAERHLPAHPPLGDPGMTLHVADRAAVLAVTSSRRAGSPSVQMPHFRGRVPELPSHMRRPGLWVPSRGRLT